MSDLLKEAIADAKAVRETALQNAKMALEEAFTPQLKSMLSAKLKEDETDDEEVPVEEAEYSDEEGEDTAVDDEEVTEQEEEDIPVDDEDIPAPDIVLGCTYPLADNYNPDANVDDGSCVFGADQPNADEVIIASDFPVQFYFTDFEAETYQYPYVGQNIATQAIWFLDPYGTGGGIAGNLTIPDIFDPMSGFHLLFRHENWQVDFG